MGMNDCATRLLPQGTRAGSLSPHSRQNQIRDRCFYKKIRNNQIMIDNARIASPKSAIMAVDGSFER